jgi:hypothetical protein
LVLVDLELIHGCPDRVLAVQVMDECHAILICANAQMPIEQHAVARVKWAKWARV